jgi:hypothetical protein
VSIKTPSNEITTAYRYDDRHYAVFVVEELGSDDGITIEFMRNAVLDRMARESGVESSQVEVLENTSSKVGNTDSTLVVYRGKVSGLYVVYANTIVIESKQVYQLITYSIGNDFSSNDRHVHDDLISRIRLE